MKVERLIDKKDIMVKKKAIKCRSLSRNIRHPCDMFVKSNFTFDLIFLIHGDSEKVGFHFFFVKNLKWQPSRNNRYFKKLTKNNTPVFYDFHVGPYDFHQIPRHSFLLSPS